eukprot:COSAG05_NODE_962_length_6414_cov_4.358353_5_plen_112_part_00
MDAPAMHDPDAASKRATVRQLGRVSAAADRAERPRCPSAWLAGSRTTFRTSCGINTAGGGLPATPWCRILSRQRRARSRILGWLEWADVPVLARKHCSTPQWLGLSRGIFA